MTGRDNLIAPLENDISKEETSVDSDDLTGKVTKSLQKNLATIVQLRNLIIERDAKRTVQLAETRQLRSGMNAVICPGDSIEIYTSKTGLWVSAGYCLLAVIHSHGIVERWGGAEIFRHPLCWARSSTNAQLIHMPTSPTDSKKDDSNALPGPSSSSSADVESTMVAVDSSVVNRAGGLTARGMHGWGSTHTLSWPKKGRVVAVVARR